jgi:hypothetical protein
VANDIGTGKAPTYLKVARSGTNFSTYTSNDGVTWSYVIGTSVELHLNGTMLAGLAVTSHNGTALGTATFDKVSIGTTAPPSPTACPTGWKCGDVGYTVLAGSQSFNGGTWTVLGAGSDITGTWDEFHYMLQSLTTDGSVSAHITSQTVTDPWAKAGVMLRRSTDVGSVYYAAFVAPSGIIVQYRANQNLNTNVINFPGKVPTYLKVARLGTTFSAYTSNDGVTWTPLAGSSVTLNLTGPVFAGVAVTSHSTLVLGRVTIDSINVNGG